MLLINHYFYPRSPCGERHCPAVIVRATLEFLSTLSLRRATQVPQPRPVVLVISIHALLAESDKQQPKSNPGAGISIHALLAESDFFIAECLQRIKISIHALLAESDGKLPVWLLLKMSFLSTLSLRRATAMLGSSTMIKPDFYPRSPCGERPPQIKMMGAPVDNFYPRSPCGERLCSIPVPPRNLTISIHALLAESDQSRPPASMLLRQFLSTLSLRRATTIDTASKNRYLHFYPRSPCGERHTSTWRTGRYLYFYPRSPCGERPIFAVRPYDAPIFLSTLSLRRATHANRYYTGLHLISIHALLAESDQTLHRGQKS